MMEDPPPLNPMLEGEATNPFSSANRENQPDPVVRAATLAALESTRNNTNTNDDTNNEARNRETHADTARLFLEEPVESGLGVGDYQDADDDVASVGNYLDQQQQEQPSSKSKPKAHPWKGNDKATASGRNYLGRRTSSDDDGINDPAVAEKSKKFSSRFVQFMADYSERNGLRQPQTAIDHDHFEVSTGFVAEGEEPHDTSNRFPTRPTDLRHVDQRVNLMDASSARYDFNDDTAVSAAAAVAAAKKEEDDVYNNFMYGFTTPSPSEYGERSGRRGSLKMIVENGVQYLRRDPAPPANLKLPTGRSGVELLDKKDGTKKMPPGRSQKIVLIPGCGGVQQYINDRDCEAADEEEEWEDFSPVKKPFLERNRKCIRCILLFMFYLCTAIFVVALLKLFRPVFYSDNENSAAMTYSPFQRPYETEAPVSLENGGGIAATRFEGVPANNNGGPSVEAASITRRKFVLEHVLEEALALEGHDPKLNPENNERAQVAMEWMAGHDTTSMILLDAFKYSKNMEDIEDPANNTPQILERYIRAVYYFEAHRDKTAMTADANLE